MRYIYCHPLFDERKCAHRFSFQLKNEFQAEGLTLERFDYYGTGESSGEFADVSFDTLRKDIATQVDGDEVCLIGLRFGASLAFSYWASGMGRVKNLVLLEPIIDGAEYVDYLHRKQHIKDLMTGRHFAELQDKGYANFEGYKTSVKFIEQIRSFHLVRMAREYVVESSVLIVQVSNQSKVDPKIVSLSRSLESSARHVFVHSAQLPVFWERIPSADYTVLTRKVLGWCRE
jgi:pimeloyl-ACP methyl ester carboxylesterase